MATDKTRYKDVKVRIPEEELAVLNCRVAKTGMSREQYIRCLIADTIPAEYPPADYRLIIRKLDELQEEYQNVYDAKGTAKEAEDIDDPGEVIKNKRKKLFQKEEIIIFFERLVFLAALVYIIFGVIFGITPMKNKDMSPKINAGDLMLFYRLENNFSIRDVVIFEKDGVSYTGRIIAKDGDTVEITNEAEVKVNGSLLAENDIYYSTPMYDNNVSYPVTLRENQYFILCDYREGAKDSRYFGAVEMEEIKGKVITIIRKNEL